MKYTNPTTCPKCAYIRKETDSAPLSECPNCGIYYEKYEAMAATRTTSNTAPTNEPSDYISTVPDNLSTNAGTQSRLTQKLPKGMLIGLCILVFLSFFGYQKYGVYRLRQQLSPLLKDTTVRVERAIAKEYLLGDSKAVLQQHIVGIETNLVNAQRLSTKSNEKISGPAIEYIKSSMNYVKNTEVFFAYLSLYLQHEALLDREIDRIKSRTKRLEDRMNRLISGTQRLQDTANDSAMEPNDRTIDQGKHIAQNYVEILNRMLPATEGRIKALEAIIDLEHELAKEFGIDTLADEQALKNDLIKIQQMLPRIKSELQTSSNALPQLEMLFK